jgi:large subunit ribosomal protein L51
MLSLARNALTAVRQKLAYVSNALPIVASIHRQQSVSNALPLVASIHMTRGQMDSGYDPYPTYDTPSPYKSRRGNKRIHNAKIFTDGLLPRPAGEWEDKPLPMPVWDPVKRDQWTRRKALFGQNDYIDILGDGTIHPWELLRAPAWLKGYRGTELQRISRQLATQGTFLQETFPSKYHQLRKQLFFLYKRSNRRKHASYWGAYRGRGRIDDPGRLR